MSTPVGMTEIGTLTPRSPRILAVLALGAMTRSQRLAYPVDNSTTNRRIARESASTYCASSSYIV